MGINSTSSHGKEQFDRVRKDCNIRSSAREGTVIDFDVTTTSLAKEEYIAFASAHVQIKYISDRLTL
jgi:hypothetical protein